jgi:hypothetical protein
VRATISAPETRLSAQQTSHDLLREVLRGVLLAAIEPRPCHDDGIDSVQWRACAVVHQLLSEHPIDRRGRCRSCRRRGDVVGRRRRRCQVHIAAHFYLHQPDDAFLLSHLLGELELAETPPSGAVAAPHRCSTGDTDVLPAVEPCPGDSHSAPSQSPAIPFAGSLPGGFPRARWPDLDHGGAGERPERPRSRRGPADDQGPPAQRSSMLLTGSATCPA